MSECESNTQMNENMRLCSYCGAKVKNDAQFCPFCGRPMNTVATKKFCVRCGTELKDEEMFCHNCGSPTPKSRDAEVMNNIAAYNNSIGKTQKTQKTISIKDNSFFSFVAWILTALFAGFLAEQLAIEISYSYFEITSEIVLLATSLFGFIVTALCGVLFWKNNKKLRLMPILSSLISSVCFLIFYLQQIYVDIIVAVSLMHIVAILFAVKVIKTRAGVLTSSFVAIALSYIIPCFMGWIHIFPFVLSLPMFLLAFSFTTKELKKVSLAKRIFRNLTIILITVALILCGAVYGLYKSWVYVEDLTDMSLAAARAECSRLLVVTQYEYSETVKKDCVIKQNTKAGTYLHPEDIITLTISKGPGVKIPDLVGKSVSEAKDTLWGLGLGVITKYEYNTKIGKDKVIRVSGYHVDEGSTVTLTVSKGPDNRVNVPNVVGLTESDARKKLQNVGFKVSVVYVNDSCDAFEYTTEVKSQSLTGKQEPGTTVTIRVARPSIDITNVYFKHNSVGGLNLEISFKNMTAKTISNIDFTARFKNSSGNNVYCSIWKSSTRKLNYTESLKSGKSDTAYWSAVIYNWDVARIYFDEIKVTFSDGTTHTMTYNGYWY